MESKARRSRALHLFPCDADASERADHLDLDRAVERDVNEELRVVLMRVQGLLGRFQALGPCTEDFPSAALLGFV